MTARTPLHDLPWTRSASGNAFRTRYRGLHVSIWRRPQGGTLHFTISGTLPASVDTTSQAIALLWRKLFQHVASAGREAAS